MLVIFNDLDFYIEQLDSPKSLAISLDGLMKLNADCKLRAIDAIHYLEGLGTKINALDYLIASQDKVTVVNFARIAQELSGDKSWSEFPNILSTSYQTARKLAKDYSKDKAKFALVIELYFLYGKLFATHTSPETVFNTVVSKVLSKIEDVTLAVACIRVYSKAVDSWYDDPHSIVGMAIDTVLELEAKN